MTLSTPKLMDCKLAASIVRTKTNGMGFAVLRYTERERSINYKYVSSSSQTRLWGMHVAGGFICY